MFRVESPPPLDFPHLAGGGGCTSERVLVDDVIVEDVIVDAVMLNPMPKINQTLAVFYILKY